MQKNSLQLSLRKLNLSTIFFINLFLILGIICQRNNLNTLILFFFFAISCFVYVFFIKSNFYDFFKYPLVFLSGMILYQNQQNSFEKFAKEFCKKRLDVIATVNDISTNKSNAKNLILDIKNIRNNGNWQNSKKRIKLSLIKDFQLNDLQVSDEIKINNLFFKFPNSFLKDNLLKENLAVYATTKTLSYELIKRPIFSLNRYFKKLRNKVFLSIRSKMNKNTFALFTSIFLGNKNNEIKTLSYFKKQFNNWGLAHYLARSGLHLVIIFLSWFMIVSVFPIPFLIKQIIICLIIFVYTFLSWSSIPFIRSLITFTLYKICILLDLQINTLHCLNLACLIMLLINPIQLFFLDFQLSFTLTFVLIWINSFNLKH